MARVLAFGITLGSLVTGVAVADARVTERSGSQHATTTSTYKVKGVAVKKYTPARPNDAPPVVMVHGGGHGNWLYRPLARALSAAGFECHALDWLNHGNSAALSPRRFVRRSITAVARREIRDVVKNLGTKPILIGHSMGGLASLTYATRRPVKRLVLLTPVVPSSVGAEPIEIPVNFDEPFRGFTYEEAKALFFTTLDPALARKYHGLLVPESPRAVWEATRWTVDIDVDKVQAPTMVVSTELDPLTPPAAVGELAEQMRADYVMVPGIGHSDILLKQPELTTLAERLRSWLGY